MNWSAASEQELVHHVREGRREAFRELVQRHQRPAYNVAYGLLGSHQDADDVAQEAFVNVHRSIGSFRGESTFATWLHRIVTNLALSRLRQRKVRQAREVSLTDPSALSHKDESDDADPDRQYLIEHALHELPTLQRAVVLLRHMEGLSTQQVSRILACSEGTVKTHLHRGLKKMRERLST